MRSKFLDRVDMATRWCSLLLSRHSSVSLGLDPFLGSQAGLLQRDVLWLGLSPWRKLKQLSAGSSCTLQVIPRQAHSSRLKQRSLFLTESCLSPRCLSCLSQKTFMTPDNPTQKGTWHSSCSATGQNCPADVQIPPVC